MSVVRPGMFVALCLLSAGACAEDAASDPITRPATKTNRWAEDWSPLADPARRTQPFDDLKYIPLFAADPKSYLSLGLTLRERFESNRTPAFGIGGPRGDAYLLQRLQIHLDARLNENWQIFAQVEDVRAPGKRVITSVDENILDLRLAFLSYSRTGEDGTFKARAGRQDFAFDLQRFVSSRDGPNVRQSFDALWADWESGPWRVLGFVSQPVQYRIYEPFDDVSTKAFRFSTLRVERKVFGDQELSAYWGLYERDGARFLDAVGNESRHVLDIRYAGPRAGSTGIWRRWARSAASAGPTSPPGRSAAASATRSTLCPGGRASASRATPPRATPAAAIPP